MGIAENKIACKRLYEEVWNQGNLSIIPEVISPNHVAYTTQGPSTGFTQLEQMVNTFRTAMPDIHWNIDEMIGEGDKLAIRLTITGTFTGMFGDIKPTGNKINFQLVHINRYIDGKCVESTTFEDRIKLYSQLGLPIPEE